MIWDLFERTLRAAGAYNHDFHESESLKGALTEEFGKELASGHSAELLKCLSRPFPRGGSSQSWERSHQKWRAPYSESIQR